MLGNGGGPGNAGLTIVSYLYMNGFMIGDLGYASAVGWVLALGLLLIALAVLVFSILRVGVHRVFTAGWWHLW